MSHCHGECAAYAASYAPHLCPASPSSPWHGWWQSGAVTFSRCFSLSLASLSGRLSRHYPDLKLSHSLWCVYERYSLVSSGSSQGSSSVICSPAGFVSSACWPYQTCPGDCLSWGSSATAVPPSCSWPRRCCWSLVAQRYASHACRSHRSCVGELGWSSCSCYFSNRGCCSGRTHRACAGWSMRCWSCSFPSMLCGPCLPSGSPSGLSHWWGGFGWGGFWCL